MPGCMPVRRLLSPALFVLFIAGAAFAQFTASIQGSVQDPSGAGVAKATIQLVNVATGVTSATTSDASGNIQLFESCPRPVQSHGRSGWLCKV